MKIRIIKVFFNLLISIITLIFFIPGAYAAGEHVVVEESRINLSPDSITKCNLNSPEIKHYLIECIEISNILPIFYIADIKEKENHISFFVLEDNLFNNEGKILLYVWVPFQVNKPTGKGYFHILPLIYKIR